MVRANFDRLGVSYLAGVERGGCHVKIQENRRKANKINSLKKDKKEARNLYSINFTSTLRKIMDK